MLDNNYTEFDCLVFMVTGIEKFSSGVETIIPMQYNLSINWQNGLKSRTNNNTFS